MQFFNIILTLIVFLLPFNVFAHTGEKCDSNVSPFISYEATSTDQFGSKYSVFRRHIDEIVANGQIKVESIDNDVLTFTVPNSYNKINQVSLHAINQTRATEIAKSAQTTYPLASFVHTNDGSRKMNANIVSGSSSPRAVPTSIAIGNAKKIRVADTNINTEGIKADASFCEISDIECYKTEQRFQIPLEQSSTFKYFQLVVQYKTGDFKSSSIFNL